jgi:hypothetical protein
MTESSSPVASVAVEPEVGPAQRGVLLVSAADAGRAEVARLPLPAIHWLDVSVNRRFVWPISAKVLLYGALTGTDHRGYLPLGHAHPVHLEDEGRAERDIETPGVRSKSARSVTRL